MPRSDFNRLTLGTRLASDLGRARQKCLSVPYGELAYVMPPSRNRVHRPEYPGFWLAVLLKPIVYTIVTLQNDPPLHTIPPDAHRLLF